MISEGQFHTEFEKIEASFARSFSDKIKDGWFKEVGNCQPQPFKRAMRKLVIGEKLPHFGHFWVQYNIARQEIEGTQEIQRGCEYCRHGFIHYVKDGYDYTAFCRVCYPERKSAQDPKIPREYQLGMEPWRSKPEVMIPPTIAKAMIRELIEKMNRGSVDWEKETQDAWELHEKAVARGSFS